MKSESPVAVRAPFLRTGTICAMFTALIAVGAFVRIPLPVVPFTLQLPVVCLAGMLLGPRRGAACATLYLLIGLMGIPVFANGGGPAYVLQPTFGYLLGFIPAAALSGYISIKSPLSLPCLAAAAGAGILVIYAAGIAYYLLLARTVLLVPIDLRQILFSFFLATIWGDLAGAAAAVFAARRLRPVLRRYLER